MESIKAYFLALASPARVIPNCMMAALGYQAYQMGGWYMSLPDPSNNQASFVTAFYTLALPAAFKFYLAKVEQ